MYDIKNLSIWKKETNNKQDDAYLQGDISDLNLSVRSYNCLKRAGCNTVGDIIKLIEADENGLRKIRNLGSRSETEILETVQQYKAEYRPLVSANLPVVKRKYVCSARQIWDSSIEEYSLSNYSLSRLKQRGINQVKDLYATDPKNEPGWYAVRELFEKLPV